MAAPVLWLGALVPSPAAAGADASFNASEIGCLPPFFELPVPPRWLTCGGPRGEAARPGPDAAGAAACSPAVAAAAAGAAAAGAEAAGAAVAGAAAGVAAVAGVAAAGTAAAGAAALEAAVAVVTAAGSATAGVAACAVASCVLTAGSPELVELWIATVGNSSSAPSGIDSLNADEDAAPLVGACAC